jgi:hypothetical protein
VYKEWTAILRAAGTSHIPFGPPLPGAAYPGIPWANPDFWADLPAFRRFVDKLIADNFVPHVFVGGDTFAVSRFEDWPRLAQALAGVHDKIIVSPAWEPVVGGWTSKQVSDATIALAQLFPSAVLAWHFSPTRWACSSNPVEPNDPWQGGESECYKDHGGEKVIMALYQLPHGSDIYGGYCNPDIEDGSCWLNRWQDGVERLGAGKNGWRIVIIVGYETVAYEAFRLAGAPDDVRAKMSKDARDIATQMRQVADLHGVRVGHGNGLPWPR